MAVGRQFPAVAAADRLLPFSCSARCRRGRQQGVLLREVEGEAGSRATRPKFTFRRPWIGADEGQAGGSQGDHRVPEGSAKKVHEARAAVCRKGCPASSGPPGHGQGPLLLARAGSAGKRSRPAPSSRWSGLRTFVEMFRGVWAASRVRGPVRAGQGRQGALHHLHRRESMRLAGHRGAGLGGGPTDGA